MKKFLICILFVSAVCASNAQDRLQAKDSCVNTDTSIIAFNSVRSDVVSIAATALKASGTVSGKIYLQATVDGLSWQNLDSLTLADVATYQTKVLSIARTTYNSYRTYVTTSGTQKFYNWFTVLRRPDE